MRRRREDSHPNWHQSPRQASTEEEPVAHIVRNYLDKKSKKVLWESIILKLKSCGRKYAKFESFLKHWKQSTCIFFTFLTLAEWPILHFKTAHFTFPNESFCRAKWAILRCKMSHFEIEKNFFSIFVRIFYPNKRFRLPRMKKNLARFFQEKHLQWSIPAFMDWSCMEGPLSSFGAKAQWN